MTENELLEELTRELGLAEREPGDVDVFMLMEATGKSESRCRGILKHKAAMGELTTAKVQGKYGMPVTVYRKIKVQATQDLK